MRTGRTGDAVLWLTIGETQCRQVSYDGSVVPKHVDSVPPLGNRSLLLPIEAQLVDQHGLATNWQGTAALRLSVWRHIAGQQHEELQEMRQEVPVPHDGAVGSCSWAVLCDAQLLGVGHCMPGCSC